MNYVKTLKKIIFIEIGTFLFAIAVGMFLLPGEILTGGVAGVTTLLRPFITIDEDILTVIISSSLFAIGSLVLGKEFLVTTAVHSLTYPFILLFVTRVIPAYEVEPILAALYGGIIGGIGIGIIFRQGGSTGGMDVPPLIVQKFFKVKASTGIMVLDALSVLAGLIIYDLNGVLIGLISVYLTTFAMERTISFYNGIVAKKFEIISDKYKEIAEDIHTVLERGTTVITAQGGYTNAERKMLVCIVPEEQYMDVKAIIDKHDPKAFVIMTETKDVNGEGFTFTPRL